MLNQDTVDWLLEDNNPPVEYLTLTKLLGKDPDDPEVLKAYNNLINYEVTNGILDQGDKFWGFEDKVYWKYTGKYWQIIFLGQFLANGKDPRIIQGVKDVIEGKKWVSDAGGQCLTANILSAFIRLGFGDHPVVQSQVESLAERTIADGGVKCEVMDYSLLPRCYMSTPKLLLCFGLIPKKKRSTPIRKAISMIQKTLVSNEINNYVPGNNRKWHTVLENAPKRAELPPGETVKQWLIDKNEEFLFENGLGERHSKPGWVRFGFPLHYNSDILEAMYALVLVNTPMSQELENPLQIIRDKATLDGKWILENSLNGKMLVDVEEKGKPSKWLTFFALYVINYFS